ncbi:MAG: hypothetical protein JRI72_13005 [Deltaproteobacteria bacterium]|nr:hypothetical protein [Deltaproteobacteria bacterium]
MSETLHYNRETVYIGLTKTTDEIWADFSSANRRAIRKAEKANFEIHVTDNNDSCRWKQFHKIYSSEMLRKGAPTHLYFSLPFFYHSCPKTVVK